MKHMNSIDKYRNNLVHIIEIDQTIRYVLIKIVIHCAYDERMKLFDDHGAYIVGQGQTSLGTSVLLIIGKYKTNLVNMILSKICVFLASWDECPGS